MAYYISSEVAGRFDQVVADVVARLKSEGFGVLSDIDVRAALKAKIGADLPAYRILGACDPKLAHDALKIESRLGVLLPCNLIVHQTAAGRVEVASVDPVVAMERTGNPALARIALEVRRRLARVVEGRAR